MYNMLRRIYEIAGLHITLIDLFTLSFECNNLSLNTILTYI